jgi:hypothetical protein
VLDPRRGYRICRYHHAKHGGTHVHYPETAAPMAIVELSKPQEAEAIMLRYHAEHDAFDFEKLQEVIEKWRSASGDR